MFNNMNALIVTATDCAKTVSVFPNCNPRSANADGTTKARTPVVIRRSIEPYYTIFLDDGIKFKMLKRHLITENIAT